LDGFFGGRMPVCAAAGRLTEPAAALVPADVRASVAAAVSTAADASQRTYLMRLRAGAFIQRHRSG
jgi:hypothetical protein